MDENIFNNWFNKSYQEQQDLLAKMEANKYEGKTLQEIFEGQDSLNFYNSSTHPCIVAPDGQNLIDLQTKKVILYDEELVEPFIKIFNNVYQLYFHIDQ